MSSFVNNSDARTTIKSALEWRYATKQFDATRKIDSDTWATIEESLILTPSSYGLQPYRFVIIQDKTLLKSLRAHSWNQSQVEDCSHYVVFSARKTMTEENVDRYVQRIAEVRSVDLETLKPYRNMMVGDVVSGPRSTVIGEWAARQAYIALGNLMTVAAVLGVDACPMEGIDPAAYDKLLNLEDSEFRTICSCAVGYRSEDDGYAAFKKVRLPARDLIQHI